ncbi:OLC1v1019490C1 [Oldenlandia corymbosa var. corymbosa]|uniref:OLC1v1019490C1 n=1 Tax=Oldenlandia corymbosa var. corymbosa TaxID=529605 RepID=A0AAV1EE95_OLDCO|nr:OLC1v1019490C1 [Oldenlandia corymbosa var. corymbosa]
MPQLKHYLPTSTLLILPINHRHHHFLLRKPPPGNIHPPPPVLLQLSLTTTTGVLCNSGYLLQSLLLCRARRWDWENSNTESFTTQIIDDDDYDDGGKETEDEQWDDVLQEYIDSIWIFKVFGSYGWALPFILVSLVITNGPKSFLLALTLAILQSTFAFAFQKMWESRGKQRSQRKTKKKKTRRSSRTENTFWEDERLGNQENKKRKMGYKSWVQSDDDSSFGGWDKLDSENEFQFRSPTKSGQRVGGRSEKSSSSEKSRISEEVRRSETPLLLRLLIAAFPFLGSWTKML